MGNYNKGGGGDRGGGGRFGGRGGGGGRSFGGGGGGRGGFGGRDRGRPEMHKAICDECGNRCEVPFKPSGDKPVLCSECFGSTGGGRDRGGRDRGGRDDRGGRRDRREDRQMHKATCAECGSKCEVPFRPTGDKPVLCSECFGGGGSGRPDPSKPYKSSQSSEKHDEILTKLDKILTLLQRTNPVKEITVMKKKTSHSEARATAKHEPQEHSDTKGKPKKTKKTKKAKKVALKKAPKKTAKKKVVKKAVKAKAKKAKK